MRKLDYKFTCTRCNGLGFKSYRHDRGVGEPIPRFDIDIEVTIVNLSNSGTTYSWNVPCSACMIGWPMKVPHCDLDQGKRTDCGITHVE
jgi:hypothetical protein